MRVSAMPKRAISDDPAIPPETQSALKLWVVLSRAPSKDEVAVVDRALQAHLARYRGDVKAAQESVRFGESKPKDGLDSAELAAYTLTANLLLNLDETVTQN